MADGTASGGSRSLTLGPREQGKWLPFEKRGFYEGLKLRKLFMMAYYAFADAYLEASAAFRSGHLDVEFPADSFPPALPFSDLDIGLAIAAAPS